MDSAQILVLCGLNMKALSCMDCQDWVSMMGSSWGENDELCRCYWTHAYAHVQLGHTLHHKSIVLGHLIGSSICACTHVAIFKGIIVQVIHLGRACQA